jgi:anaerobic ribonucleoside-triphosphate reductase activating protein
MLLRLNQVVFGLSRGVLGASPNRMGIWTQGCSLPKCPGCSSTHTWPTEGGRELPVASLIRLARLQEPVPSGLTVSGGEPTDQAVGVQALVEVFRMTFPGTEVVLYTGLRWEAFADRFPALRALLDVVVAGPYVRTLEATPLSGSSNQEVRLLTPLAKRLYEGWPSWPRHAVQVGQGKTDQVITVGIPHTPRLTQAARQVGAVGMTWDPIDRRRHT